jgi:hypothetical protein
MEKEGKQCLKNVDVEEVPRDSVKAFGGLSKCRTVGRKEEIWF